MSKPEADDELEPLADLLRSANQSELDETQQRLRRASFLARADADADDARAARRRWLFALPALAAAVVLGVLVLTTRSLSFEVVGAPPDGAYVRAPSDRSAEVQFSDRTRVVAAAGSRLRIEETSARGARVLVERGRADANVTHSATSNWTFVAGPFEVLVTGTRFVLDWDPSRESLDLTLVEGSVEVRGPTGTGPVVVRAGQKLHADAQRRSMLVSDAVARAEPAGPAKAAEPEHASPTEPSAPAAHASGALRGSTAQGEPKPDTWQQRITRGEFKSIVAEAEERGVSNCLTTCGSEDLRALSDAARYTGRADLAEQSLLALRKRFGAAAGRDAAFLLGRLEERRGALDRAQTWYDTYLREAPSGDFAAEAWAGKMRAVKKLQGIKAAAPIAREYLARFPKGVHVSAAREILESP